MGFDLRSVQLVQLEALLELDRICRKHNINYYLIGGAAIGAVRHQGCIPWDDDIDVGMKRKEYEKFLTLCQNELGPRYFLQTYETDRAYIGQYAKIRVNNTTFVEKNTERVRMHQGVFIDIFPLDNVPKGSFSRFVQRNLVKLLWTACFIRIGIYSKWPIKRFAQKLIYEPIVWLLPKIYHDRLLTRIASMYSQKDTVYITNFFGRYGYAKETVPTDYFGKPCRLMFEGHSLPLPEKWHEYLAHIYGDYKTPPPKENRGSHNISIVDLEKPYEYYLDRKER